MKKRLEQTGSENKLAPEPALVTDGLLTDLCLAEPQAAQVKGGPSGGRDLLIGGSGGDEKQSAESERYGFVTLISDMGGQL